jgi:uncharacterized protein (DUF3084 family)
MTSNHIAWYNMMETKRHNEALEMQNLGSLQENRRHNIAVETETHRSNVVYEQVALRNATVNERNATVNERNATTNERNAAVNERNAAVNERNAATNEYNAQTNRMSVGIQAQALTETITHNRAMEAAKQSELAISRESNRIKEMTVGSQIRLNQSNTRLNNARASESEANAALKSMEIQLRGKELENSDDYYHDRHTGMVIDNVRNVVGTITDTVNLGARVVGLYNTITGRGTR